MKEIDLVIIGGGPAGMAAAISAKNKGIDDILILEREDSLGGILNQCIHTGFGLHVFKENLSGPEYAQRLINEINRLEIEYKTDTMVLSIDKDKIIKAVSPEDGMFGIKAKAIILASGCRERPKGAINIPGSKCAGIYTAGSIQKFINIEGYMPGKEVVILGSGDVALVMARRMALEGANIKAVVEIMPYCYGTENNVVNCLDEFDIPLKLGHTVVNIKGKDRVEGVTIARVDEDRIPIPGTEMYIPCDTLVLSVELRGDSEIIRKTGIELNKSTWGPKVGENFQTMVEGIFACGNVLHVYDTADNVTKEGYSVGENASQYIKGKSFLEGERVGLWADKGIRYLLPNFINLHNLKEDVQLKLKFDKLYENQNIYIYFDKAKEKLSSNENIKPGDIINIKISKNKLLSYKDLKKIIIGIK
ncbi:FAD-binding protein [Clostridium botulinum]|uniref:Oxidoreductase n=4 Tax=Clostridium TaxID=1485 RepID=A5I740_CLOBH|nr:MULTISPECIES: FAD-dependent oxidoreductase [Clostridium]EKX80684.1 sarcosine oxidase alpha subunit [Clostridium botulinum CFSAN001628]EPS47898.1 sarcosine oxidase alpha subunit [Clostridium botulinum CFSAN002369]ABS33646.1 pyridine nucleotide-disulfide oxidoreductase [Clostridium botulinum A str. ATCC 19397]ABS38527.1 pyridine nucleotide-disulfide oxidoreductase [Clostridium botulinum A str. Hall]ABS42709.1 pyridine nucleotide-disulfide oxidoreductase [Clostridium botulinum F str. Langeland